MTQLALGEIPALPLVPGTTLGPDLAAGARVTFTWPAGSHWCACGVDGEGSVLSGPGTIGRGATKEAAEGDFLQRASSAGQG